MNGFVREHLERQVESLRDKLHRNNNFIDELAAQTTAARARGGLIETELSAFEAALEGTA